MSKLSTVSTWDKLCNDLSMAQRPILSNLYLHYAMDMWLKTNYPDYAFERYADDAVIHCRTEEQAIRLKESLGERLKDCGLEMHGSVRISG